MRFLFRSLAAVLFFAVAGTLWLPPARAQMGYEGQDLERMGQWLQFNQLELYRLEIPLYAAPYAAALTSGKHGWRIVVFLRDGGVTNVDWDSGYLKRPFQVASTDNFVLIPQIEKNFGVTFSGCKRAACATNYGALLYLPWSHRLFEKSVAGSSVACSQSLVDPANAPALAALDAALRRQQAAIARYMPPRCPGAVSSVR